MLKKIREKQIKLRVEG
jgi:hypothetical protein